MLLIVGTSLAENTQTQNETLTFKGIAWNQAIDDVAKELDADPNLTHGDEYIHENTTLENHLGYDYKNSGITMLYKAKVAGYDAWLTAEFIYPIVDFVVDREYSDATLYAAIYNFSGMSDYQAGYDDLCVKLSSLYGPYETNTHKNILTGTESSRGAKWVATDGSIIYLRMDKELFTGVANGLYLIYESQETTDSLRHVENPDDYRRSEEKRLKEEEEERLREENQNNIDGL